MSSASVRLRTTVTVTVPTNLDSAAASALRTYAQAEKDSGFSPREDWMKKNNQ